MQSTIDQIKRQTEIAALCMKAAGAKITTDYLSWLYKVETVTINRDLNSLRKTGIDIHSDKNKGIVIDNKPDPVTLRIMFLKYVALFESEYSLQLAEFLLRMNNQIILSFITLRHCIEKKVQAKVLYSEENKRDPKKMIILPTKIYNENGEPMLTASVYGMFDQLYFSNIQDIRPVNIN
jgi:predicted DNA-binding transcriptional regulator YafY